MKPVGLFLTLSFFVCSIVTSQEQLTVTFGELTPDDLSFKTYEDDPDASAVVLYEKGKTDVQVVNGYIKLVTTTHKRIKVLDIKKFDGGTIHIPFYQFKKSKEFVKDIKAITHNDKLKHYVKEDQIYTKDDGTKWWSTSFAFPNIQNGSILEYSYRIESPFFNTFEWEFQGEYPVLYSELVTEIPGNFQYRAALIGGRKLAYENTSLKKHCFSVEGIGDTADCALAEYVMRNIPAFKGEDHMLAESNYIAKAKYELIQYESLRGEVTRYTKSWKDVDKEFRHDKDIGRQLRNESYFKGAIPQNILEIPDDLTRAQAIYYFIQEHFTWNERFRIYSEIRVKDAFENKTGNSGEINLALINALRAGDLDVELALSATRNRRIPTQLYPILTEFNYVTAFLIIGETSYFLDATDATTPFGLLPVRALNSTALIMDFKNGSYWEPVKPFDKSVTFLNINLNLDEHGLIAGGVEEKSKGYFGVKKRTNIKEKTKEKYLSDRIGPNKDVTIENYKVENTNELSETLSESYTVTIEPELIVNNLYIRPFFLNDDFSKNPFQLKERDYPIDLGYPSRYTILLTLNIPEGYTVIGVPENKTVKLPGNQGTFQMVFAQTETGVSSRFVVHLANSHFTTDFYPALKEFYQNIVDSKRNTTLLIQKK